MQKIGFIGLGTMGTPMALNILRGGFELVVYNRNALKCAPLVDKGALLAASPMEVAERCEITLAIVSDPEAALEVALGPAGALKGLSPGKGYIDLSTVDAVTSRRIEAAAAEAGARFLEAPVSGSKKPAEEGNLIILAAGDKGLYDEALPLFGILGKSSHYLGAVGQGAMMKLAVNMVMGSMTVALAEGLSLAKGAGLDPSALLAVLDEGVVSNPLFRLKGPAMLRGEFPTAFPLKHMQKDMRLALEAGDAAGSALTVATAANEKFLEALSDGNGEEDMSAVYKVFK
ncbi:MAG: NAD(P)-dependent oxidoreductase [Deltaproteobacteria bacterium]|nr:MAG: NAD(P)-dependent oxidoreductase [Deltaproteobacteria bacterium]